MRLQIYFLPDAELSAIPFLALKLGGQFLTEKATVVQAPSIDALDSARKGWDDLCEMALPPSPKVGRLMRLLSLEEGQGRISASYTSSSSSSSSPPPLPLQALVVSSYEWKALPSALFELYKDLSRIVPAEVVSGDDATKQKVAKQIASEPASLIHFITRRVAKGRVPDYTHRLHSSLGIRACDFPPSLPSRIARDSQERNGPLPGI